MLSTYGHMAAADSFTRSHFHWKNVVPRRLTGFSGNRAGPAFLEQSVRLNAAAHGTCFAIHVLLAVLALFSRHSWSDALSMLFPGVVVHLYPCCSEDH